MICHLIHQMNLNQYLYEKCSQMKIICFVCRRMHVHVKTKKTKKNLFAYTYYSENHNITFNNEMFLFHFPSMIKFLSQFPKWSPFLT